MIIRFLFKKIAAYTIISFAACYALLFTNFGVKSVLFIAKPFIPIKYSYSKIQGSLVKGIRVSGVKILFDKQEYDIENIKLFYNGTLSLFAKNKDDFIDIKNNGELIKARFAGHLVDFDVTKNFNITYQYNDIVDIKTTGSALKHKLHVKIAADKKFIIDEIFDASLTIDEDKLNYKINNSSNFDYIIKAIPQLGRLKADIAAHLITNKNIFNLKPKLTAELNEISAMLPPYGIKLKPGNIKITSSDMMRYSAEGKVFMHKSHQLVNIKGFINPFEPNVPHNLNLQTDKAALINNEQIQVTVNSDVNLTYNKERLVLAGQLEILNGKIMLKNDDPTIVLTDDLVIVTKSTKIKPSFIFTPDLDIKISKDVRFSGYDINTGLKGKIKITRPYTSYLAEGNIELINGNYNLPGQKFKITKGKIFYQPGNLLSNPHLDLVLKKHQTKILNQLDIDKTGIKSTTGNDAMLFVSGTASSPKIKEVGMTGDKNKALEQMFKYGQAGVIDDLKNKMGISDITITENEKQQSKHLSIGKKLNKKAYLEYSQDLEKQNSKVKLQYALSRIWSIGIDTGQAGSGADLQFTYEK